MKGSHDNKLGQACQSSIGKFKIGLLNQLSDSDHHVINMTFGTKLPNEFVNGDDVADRGWGTSYFISHDSLIQSNSYYNYYNNNIVYFRISSYDDIDYQLL